MKIAKNTPVSKTDQKEKISTREKDIRQSCKRFDNSYHRKR
jgi:hypothetical protein